MLCQMEIYIDFCSQNHQYRFLDLPDKTDMQKLLGYIKVLQKIHVFALHNGISLIIPY